MNMCKKLWNKIPSWILHCACLSWAKIFIHYNHLPIKALSFLKIASMYSCHGPKLPTWSELESYAVIFDKNLRYKNVFCICQTFFLQNWYEILLKVFNFLGLVFCFYTNIFLKKIPWCNYFLVSHAGNFTFSKFGHVSSWLIKGKWLRYWIN